MSTEEKKGKKERKSKKGEVPVEKPVFPHKGFVNAYGFIHISNGVAEAFGAPKGSKMDVTIDLQDGALVIRKA